jgi:lipopolysaccharide/colanic/teichoic acid biosynthesis glycosyltransferase
VVGLTRDVMASPVAIPSHRTGLDVAEHPLVRCASKRCLDVALAAVALVLLLPVLLLVAVAVGLDSGWPALYGQTRVGLNGRRFRIWKFRTMVRDADRLRAALEHLNEAPFPAFKMRKDPRITRIGHILRRTRMDELPQLWNVLRGDMSFVGPRPPLPSEVEHYDELARRRLLVRPGITCTWQVKGRLADAATFDDWVRTDLAYIDGWSFWLDLVLLYQTVQLVIRMKGI